MEFTVEKFLEDPSFEVLDKLNKSDLIKISEHFQGKAKISMRKRLIKNEVIDILVDEEILDESTLQYKKDVLDDSDVFSMKEMECKYRLQEKLELESMKLQHEEKLRLQELELRQKLEMEKLQFEKEKLDKELEMKERIEKDKIAAQISEKTSSHTSHFDASKYIRFVPKFLDSDVDQFFLHFEKIAINMKWPKEQWSLMLQSALTGKAREVFSSLNLQDSSDYDILKQNILRAYELVPEAYRQKFRTSKKGPDQTHVEFARDKEQHLNRWVAAKEVNENYEKMRQLILIEEFKRQVHLDIKTHLDESNVETLSQAAKMADDYAITHKTTCKVNIGQNRDVSTTKSAPQKFDKHLSKSQSVPQSVPSCAYCKKKGHLVSQCYRLKGKQNNSDSTSVACAVKVNKRLTTKPKFLKNKESETGEIREEFKPFVIEGSVSLVNDEENSQPINIMRDTACGQSAILESALPFSDKTSAGVDVLVRGIGMDFISFPLHNIQLQSDLVSGTVTVGVRKELPIKGISMLLGNDLAGNKVLPDKVPNPVVTNKPVMKIDDEDDKKVFPSCVVTRAMSRQAILEDVEQPQNVSEINNSQENRTGLFSNLGDTFFSELGDQDDNENPIKNPVQNENSKHEKNRDCNQDPINHKKLVSEQEKDPELVKITQRSLTTEETTEVPVCYYKFNGVLMRKYRPPDAKVDEEWRVYNQIVVPKVYRNEVISLAHDTPMSGHLGVRKTRDKILHHFWWPALRKDVSQYIRTCHTCQMVGKPNQKIPVAPLHPIPAFREPFSRVLIDCVGPLPKTKSGNQYLLTIMCTSTRFPEAIPLRNIKTPQIVKALVKFFTLVGLPKEIQSDQGSNFMSNLFQQVMHQLGIEQFKSSAYHPESQGALERFHQTLKNMIKTYCFEFENDWDEGVHMLLFAAREAVQESLGFSPFELVFGHSVRGPLKLLKEKWLDDDTDMNLLDYVSKFKTRLFRATEVAQENLKHSQSQMKTWYDKDAKDRIFEKGDQVLVLFPLQGNPLQARFTGPFEIESRSGDLNYILKTPGRRKARQLCHVNMLKKYVDRSQPNTQSVCVTVPVHEEPGDEKTPSGHTENCDNSNFDKSADKNSEYCLKNSTVLSNLTQKWAHLPTEQQNDLQDLVHEWESIFPDVPNTTNLAYHDIDIGESQPIKQNPYRVNPLRQEILKKEIDYMLENNIIEPSTSEWSSPCMLIPKPNGTFRFVTDFRVVNKRSKTDCYPIPRIDDCIDKIGNSTFVSKFDLLKGYWQVPLTEKAKEITAFCTPSGFYQYKKMPFGLKNAPATFQRLVNSLVSDLNNCEAYIDDIIVYSQTWSQHVQQLHQLFERLSKANLTVNLVKSEFGHATVTYLGYVVGQGHVKPIKAKIEGIEQFPTPSTKKELMRFLGMSGYYRKFCANFSDIAQPLTNLLKKSAKFIWSAQCQSAFEKIKAILVNAPVLCAPDFSKQFTLVTDASDIGCGGVLIQEGDDGIEHPLCYFSKKFDKHQQNYSTIEKECLALVLALQHFDVYLNTTVHPVLVFTDHNPLTFMQTMKNKNQRLVRWRLTLQEYNLIVKHIKGKDNLVADALSRAM